ncbi:IS701 family transposase [Sphaerisporangium corydalis]|uniref:IS701 family transposase n=1 Tax=Sphaerisporangium corydalis TaxID=1441875 RepID=A0ABV9EQ71_9ACTN
MAALARLEQLGASRLRSGLDEAFAQVAGRFGRREVRLRARLCVEGLLSGLERKNGWSLAEYAGEATPDGMQRLFTTAKWDADEVRDDVRDYMIGRLGDPDGVLVGDDTGFEKKGTCSAGVQRQYTGTTGKITNCQIGVFLGYTTGRGRALVDRELYVPRASWIADPGRCARAKIPDQVGFATKPQLLQAMIERAITAEVPFGWVTADEAYGDNGPLRRFLEDHRLAYVLAVSCDHHITTPAGRIRADSMVRQIPRTGWQRLSCGNGAKGERDYDWALVATTGPAHHLLIRRSIRTPSQLAFYLCHTPAPAPLHRLGAVYGSDHVVEVRSFSHMIEPRRWSPAS